MRQSIIVTTLLLGALVSSGCSATLGQRADGSAGERDGAPLLDGGGLTDSGAAPDGPAPTEGGAGDDAGPWTGATFGATTADHPNPERGFYAFTKDLAELDDGGIGWIRDDLGLRLGYVPTLLSAYSGGALPQGYLDKLDAGFAVARSGGIKLIVRFAYNYESGGGDAPLSIVLQHIGQLGPLLQKNADVVAYLQAGFIGAWGEWHSSTHDLTTDANRATIRDALLAAAPAGLPVQFRYVPDMIKWYPTVLGPAQAFDGSDQARVAFHNDCFMSSDTDVGTYSSDAKIAAQQRAYAKALSVWTPFGGETCDAGSASGQRRSCSAILAEGRDYHLAYLNVGYYKAFHEQWKAEGCYDEVSRTMGYRFQLAGVSHPARAGRGATVPVRIDLRNLGWSRIFSARALVVTLRHEGSGAELTGKPTGDLRQLAPLSTASTRVDASVSIPAGAAAGDYAVLLAVPDIYPTTAPDPRFAVRFANADDPAQGQAWDPATARFATGTTVAVEQ